MDDWFLAIDGGVMVVVGTVEMTADANPRVSSEPKLNALE